MSTRFIQLSLDVKRLPSKERSFCSGATVIFTRVPVHNKNNLEASDEPKAPGALAAASGRIVNTNTRRRVATGIQLGPGFKVPSTQQTNLRRDAVDKFEERCCRKRKHTRCTASKQNVNQALCGQATGGVSRCTSGGLPPAVLRCVFCPFYRREKGDVARQQADGSRIVGCT